MATILDYCTLVRSKNAGPFVLTFDFMFRDQAAYEHVRDAGVLTAELFARLYRVAEEHITLVFHERALALNENAAALRPERAAGLDQHLSRGGVDHVRGGPRPLHLRGVDRDPGDPRLLELGDLLRSDAPPLLDDLLAALRVRDGAADLAAVAGRPDAEGELPFLDPDLDRSVERPDDRGGAG